MLEKEYRLYVKHDKKTLIDKSAPLTLHDVIHKLFIKLQKLNAMRCVDDGYFLETLDYNRKEVVVKRFMITVRIPYTQFIIKKETAGSINQELFISTLRYIKENYYEGI